MDRPSFLAKAEALLERVSYFANRRYCDPPDVLPFFDQWLPMRTILQQQEGELFADLPPLAKPTASSTTDNQGRGYVEGDKIMALYQDIRYSISVIQKLPKLAVNVPMAVTREGVFFGGQYFDALSRVSELVRSAKTSVLLIDGYVNEQVLKTFTVKADSVSVRILTREAKDTPALEAAAIAFNKQHGGLAIALSFAFHDRFLVIDDADFYHLGASVKDAGGKGTMFSRIEEPDVLTALDELIEGAWKAAKRLI